MQAYRKGQPLHFAAAVHFGNSILLRSFDVLRMHGEFTLLYLASSLLVREARNDGPNALCIHDLILIQCMSEGKGHDQHDFTCLLTE